MLKIRLLTDPLLEEKQTKIGLYDGLSRIPCPEIQSFREITQNCVGLHATKLTLLYLSQTNICFCYLF